MRIALLDDDEHLLDLAASVLTDAGHSCHAFSRSKDLQFELKRESFDLLLIDWVLPDISGLDVLKQLRDQSTISVPVVMMTARDSEADIVEALEAGADDYLVKPLRPPVLIARVNALLRRSQPPLDAGRTFTYGPFKLDVSTHEAWRDGQAIELSRKEFDLALFLLRNVGRALSRGHIGETVWGQVEDVPSRTIDTHVSRVRTKFDLRPESGYMLAPIYSYGYRLEVLDGPLP